MARITAYCAVVFCLRPLALAVLSPRPVQACCLKSRVVCLLARSMLSLCTGLGMLVCGVSGTAAEPPLTVVGPSIVVIDSTSNAGSTPLLLRNKAAHPVKIFLYAQDFKSKTTDEWLNAKLTFHDASSETGTILHKKKRMAY